MPSKYVVTTQGQAWDMIALASLGSEKQMGFLLPENINETDTLLFGGNMRVAVPDIQPPAVRNLPPWERM